MFEEDRSVLMNVIEKMKDIRRDDLAIETNEQLNDTPQMEEILKAINEMKDSAQDEDGVYMRYICSGC